MPSGMMAVKEARYIQSGNYDNTDKLWFFLVPNSPAWSCHRSASLRDHRLGGGKGEVPGAGLGVVPGAAGVAPGGGVAVGPGVPPGVRAGVGVGEGPVSSKAAGRLPAWHRGTI